MTDDSLHKVVIRQETPNDSEEIRALLAKAFPSNTEAHLVGALRRADNLSIALVAELTGRIIGMVAFSPVQVKGENDATGLGLAPVVVAPEFKKTGIGSRLIREGVRKARGNGCPFIVVLGEPDYYRRFGFETASAYDIHSPCPAEYFMALFSYKTPVQCSGTAYYTKEFDGL